MIFKTKKIAFSIVSILLCLNLWLYFLPPQNRWLLINQFEAEKYAYELLNNGKYSGTPSTFVDYSVVVENGYVLFYSHNENDLVLGFFPNGISSTRDTKAWGKISESWYVSQR